MPRLLRVVVPGYPLHVTQRGNYGQEVFGGDDDRQQYLRWLKDYKAKHGLLVWAWCLMDNHVHLICVPGGPDSLSEALRHTHMRYANYFNRKCRRQGHLWQGRFFSCVLDSAHLWAAVRYVERNPVRRGVAPRAEDYPWSSARARVSGEPDGILDEGLPVEDAITGDVEDWSEWLRVPEDEKLVRRLRMNTFRGRPMGGARFVTMIESLLDRRLSPRARGRPRTGEELGQR